MLELKEETRQVDYLGQDMLKKNTSSGFALFKGNLTSAPMASADSIISTKRVLSSAVPCLCVV